ncbi:DUF443 family protein [Streptococcus oricebi]|uniref:DUF443 family protein n=1 Tax=Streptococcus oricebi TaxID=1547447 RepID=A0ABS5B1A6_9STRE|nr:DUF443 family protein [Streptococcus oricebi]MBP2622604.1 hypothetical protein [Streptococcus oricebi]
MIKVIISEIQNNPRYRLIQADGNRWLMDIDNNKISILFYPLNWLVAQKVYRISDKEFSKLATIHSGSRLGKSLIPVSAILGVILARVLKLDLAISPRVGDLTFFLVLVMALVFISLFIRFVSTELRARRIEKMIDLKTLQVEKVYIRPTLNGQMIKFFLSYLLMLFLTVFSFALFLMYDSWLFTILFTIIFIGLLFTNFLSFTEGEYLLRKK